MYIEGRVRVYESTRWITINCVSVSTCHFNPCGPGKRAYSIPQFLEFEEDIP